MVCSNSSSVFFQNVDELIAYLYTKVDTLSPLKLQKGLYFLYAYYLAMYSEVSEGEGEIDYDLPKELFPAQFEAWNYGPVIRDVYHQRKNGEDYYKNLSEKFDFDTKFNTNSEKEVKSFIDDLFSQIYKASDFSLVDRSHSDKAWEDAFNKGKSTIISNNLIKNEYKAKFTRR